MLPLISTISLLLPALTAVSAFPQYGSLAGLTPAQVRAVARTFTSTPGAQSPPPPINDTSSKLVADDEHPWMPLRPGDIRGPCPGLNTLASHGYLNRTGVVTPGEIITAVQEGFNMGWSLATFVTYGAFVVDGNHLTNLLSIGMKTPETGPDAPAPAIIGGLNTHGEFEGDASTTRGDAYFGDNFSFNETLFGQLTQAAYDVGNGTINIPSSALHRHNRILDSMARNPNFTFTTPRYFTAYAETTFPMAFFVSKQDANTTQSANLDDARSFFQNSKYPDGFFRRDGAYDFDQVGTMMSEVFAPYPVLPGHNEGAGNYVLDPEDPGFAGGGLCYAYQRQTNLTASLYPDPTDDLRAALKQNLVTLYEAMGDPTCEQLFPFGQ